MGANIQIIQIDSISPKVNIEPPSLSNSIDAVRAAKKTTFVNRKQFL